MMSKNDIKFISLMGLLIFLLLIGIWVSLSTGFTKISTEELISILLGNGTRSQNLFLFEMRMPRMVLAFLAGAGLAVAGCVFQAIAKNDLADTGLLGINAGGNLTVLIYLLFFPTLQAQNLFILPIVSFVGAGFTALFIMRLATINGKTLSPIRLTLVGLVVSAGYNSLIIIFTMSLTPAQFNFVNTWLIGSVWGTSWKHVLALLPWVVILIGVFVIKSMWLDVLRLNDEISIGLGSNLQKHRKIYLLLATALAAACVSLAGSIGFVGLICSHLARRLVSPMHRYSIPLTALIGGILLVYADAISRILIAPLEFPIGIIVAIIGAPYFLYLLFKSKY